MKNEEVRHELRLFDLEVARPSVLHSQFSILHSSFRACSFPANAVRGAESPARDEGSWRVLILTFLVVAAFLCALPCLAEQYGPISIVPTPGFGGGEIGVVEHRFQIVSRSSEAHEIVLTLVSTPYPSRRGDGEER